MKSVRFSATLLGLGLLAIAGPASAKVLLGGETAMPVVEAVFVLTIVGVYRFGHVLMARRRRRFTIHRRLMNR